MTSVQWLIVVVCLLAAVALVVSEIVLAHRVTGDGAKARGVDPAAAVKALAEKAPRLAAALTFVLLALFASGLLTVTAAAGAQ